MKREVVYDEAGNIVKENVKEVKIFKTGDHEKGDNVWDLSGNDSFLL